MAITDSTTYEPPPRNRTLFATTSKPTSWWTIGLIAVAAWWLWKGK